jgi:cyclic pyranopterin phosphate synthase
VSRLTHLNAAGAAEMVDVSVKTPSARVAVAVARLRMLPTTLEEIFAGRVPKGDVLAVARVAGIQAAKRTSELIPLCHPLALTYVGVRFERFDPDALDVTAECRVTGQTGVEMEALTAAAIAALTVYDMCKAVDRAMVVESVRLLSKSGGRSGEWAAEASPA